MQLVGQRAYWEPRTVLVTGAGPIGLLAALVGNQRGLEVHVLDRVETGPKPELVRALGATYHTGSATGIGFDPDVIIECTGVGQVIADSLRCRGARAASCASPGVGRGGRTAGLSTADVAATMVLQNNVVVGQRQRQQASLVQGRTGAGAAPTAPGWRGSSRAVRHPRRSCSALQRQPDDIKVVIQFAQA